MSTFRTRSKKRYSIIEFPLIGQGRVVIGYRDDLAEARKLGMAVDLDSGLVRGEAGDEYFGDHEATEWSVAHGLRW